MSVQRPVPGSHGPPCTAGVDGGSCHRCAGAQPGNQLATKHGAYATLALGDRAAELADEIRPEVPGFSAGDEPALRLLALTLARVEKVAEALEHAEVGDLERLRQDGLGWARLSRGLLNDLGLTPTSRARMGLDVARAKGAALAAHVAERYSEGGDT